MLSTCLQPSTVYTLLRILRLSSVLPIGAFPAGGTGFNSCSGVFCGLQSTFPACLSPLLGLSLVLVPAPCGRVVALRQNIHSRLRPLLWLFLGPPFQVSPLVSGPGRRTVSGWQVLPLVCCCVALLHSGPVQSTWGWPKTVLLPSGAQFCIQDQVSPQAVDLKCSVAFRYTFSGLQVPSPVRCCISVCALALRSRSVHIGWPENVRLPSGVKFHVCRYPPWSDVAFRPRSSLYRRLASVVLLPSCAQFQVYRCCLMLQARVSPREFGLRRKGIAS